MYRFIEGSNGEIDAAGSHRLFLEICRASIGDCIELHLPLDERQRSQLNRLIERVFDDDSRDLNETNSQARLAYHPSGRFLFMIDGNFVSALKKRGEEIAGNIRELLRQFAGEGKCFIFRKNTSDLNSG